MIIEGIKITNDYIFKKIFQDTEILCDLVSSIIGEKLTSLKIINTEVLPETIGDKLSRLDILAETEFREKINIEMQLSYNEGFDDRMAFYAMRLHAGNVKEGEKYQDVKRTIVIDILDFGHKLLKDRKDFCTDFRLRSSDGRITLTQKFAMYFVELPKIPDATLDSLTKLEKWLCFLKNEGGKEMVQVLEREPMIARAMTVAEALAKNEHERLMAQRREDGIRDYNWRMSTAHDEGMAQGVAQGIDIGKLDIVKRMVQFQMPIQQISLLSGLPEDEVLKAISEDTDEN